MIRHNYLQEIGLKPAEQTVPWPYAAAILAILVGAGWVAMRETEPAIGLAARDPPSVMNIHSAAASAAASKVLAKPASRQGPVEGKRDLDGQVRHAG